MTIFLPKFPHQFLYFSIFSVNTLSFNVLYFSKSTFTKGFWPDFGTFTKDFWPNLGTFTKDFQLYIGTFAKKIRSPELSR